MDQPAGPASPGRGPAVRNLVIRLFINAVALWGAASVVSGIELSDDFWAVLVVALIFGVVNALIKPVVTLLALPLLILTLGLLTLVINAGMLLLTAALTRHLSVAGFWPALLGGLVISVVSLLLSVFLKEKRAEV